MIQIVNPLGIKGLREIGIVGVAAAIAIAVFHATGKCHHELAITLDNVRARRFRLKHRNIWLWQSQPLGWTMSSCFAKRLKIQASADRP